MMLACCFLSASWAQGSEADTKYNFLFIFVDDQGWGGTSVPMLRGNDASRTPAYRMPNLEKVASQGMVFSQAYAGHPKCECSRASLLMGRTTTSLNATEKNSRRWNAPVTDSLANTLKRADSSYAAAHFGKWQWPQTPESMGFDASDGITMNEDGDSNDPEDPKQSFGITRRAMDYMNKNVKQGKPFYLQLSYYAVHSQPQALASTLKKYQGAEVKKQPAGKQGRGNSPIQAAMTEDLDTCIGKLLGGLEELGITDRTYVIYMSDNGMGSRLLKGGKTILDEGGIRVPLIVKGPGVAGGVYSQTPVAGYDIFATVLDLVSPSTQLPAGVEGGSWKPLFKDGTGRVSRSIDRMVWHHDVEVEHPQTALRKGNYKLLHYWDTKQDFLYDLSNDMGETKNLAEAKPELVASLFGEMKEHVRKGLGDARYGMLESGKIVGSARGGLGKEQQKKGNRDAAKKKARPKNAMQ